MGSVDNYLGRKPLFAVLCVVLFLWVLDAPLSANTADFPECAGPIWTNHDSTGCNETARLGEPLASG